MSMFKPVEECVELYKQGKEEDSGFWYVFNCEESNLEEFDINGDTDAQLKTLKDDYKENGWSEIDVDNGRDIFMEFTAKICPAYKA